jgi:hypothetical protein
VNKSEQNISALNDTITIVKKKNGALNFSIDGFVATTKELKTLNKSLYDQVKDQSGKVLSLNNAVITLTQDKTELQKYIDVLKSNTNQVNQLNDSTYLVPWTLAYKYDQDNSDLFVGQTLMRLNVKNKLKLQQLNSELIKRETNIGLTFGQKVEDGKLRVFVESKYPGFDVSKMQGYLIDPNSDPIVKKLLKKKHWFQGFQVGFGFTPGWNITTGSFGMTVGPTIIWSIYSL